MNRALESPTEKLMLPGHAIVLRPLGPDDLDAVLTIHADPLPNTHNPAGPLTDVKEARRVLDRWLDDWRAHAIAYWALENESVRTAHKAGLHEVGRDPWGRIVLADRPLEPELLAALPLGGRAADLER